VLELCAASEWRLCEREACQSKVHDARVMPWGPKCVVEGSWGGVGWVVGVLSLVMHICWAAVGARAGVDLLDQKKASESLPTNAERATCSHELEFQRTPE